MGISRIEGTIWGDGRAFPPPLVGQGWEWDDLPFGYAAPVSALQFNENLFTIEVTPGEAGGSPAMVNSGPVPDYVSIDARVSTAAAGTRGRIEVERGGRSDSVVVKGTIAADARPQTSTHAVERPSRYFAAALKKSLQDEGIDVTQAGIRTSDEPDSAAPTEGEILWSHCSAPLAEILKPLLKLSQNLYAETLARTLGLVLRDQGDFRAAREVVEETMEGMEVLKGTYAYVDGSGLSRHNLVSADMLVRILRYMRGHKDFSIFYDSLPIAGVDGTLRSRMSGTRAENNFRGKTGSINYARCVSGYLHTADGEMLAVAIIANNFLAPARTAEDAMDAALARLAEFHREEEPK
jgi:PBP4 family serine-type D-alanyl-D-alanine carboxypeptidase